MKSLVFLAIAVSILFASCSTSKNLGKQISLPKTVLSTEAITKFNLTPKITSLGVQFFTDTLVEIRLDPIKHEKYFSNLMPDGSIALALEPVKSIVFKPGTLGSIIKPGDLVISKTTKKIETIKISFDFHEDKDGNKIYHYLAFGPSKDEEGSFVLLPDREGNITYDGIDYQIVSGKFSYLYFSYMYFEGQPSEYIVPGMEVVPKK